jgi:hypothetical protein
MDPSVLRALSLGGPVQAVNDTAQRVPLTPASVATLLASVGTITAHVRNVRAYEAGRQAQNLLDDTVTMLTQCLAAPFADSAGWPVGWQGDGAFSEDIDRIRALASALYHTNRYLAVDTVERTLEQLAQRLADEWRPRRQPPPDRTGWRNPVPTKSEPAVVVIDALRSLLQDAFHARFDRRALHTGRRLLALATAAAQDGHIAALHADREALIWALSEISRHEDIATEERQYVLHAGLIAEADSVLDAGLQDARVFPLAQGLVDVMTMPDPDTRTSLDTHAWRARLAAVGWPVDAPAHRKPDRADLPDLPALPVTVLTLAEEFLRHGFHDLVFTATAVVTLWANAVAAARRQDTAPADSLGRTLSRRRAHLAEILDRIRTAASVGSDDSVERNEPIHADGAGVSTRTIHSQARPFDRLEALCDAALTWVEALIGDGDMQEASVPVADPTSHTSLQTSADVVATRRYFGMCSAADGPTVVVEEQDGSRRYFVRPPRAWDHLSARLP